MTYRISYKYLFLLVLIAIGLLLLYRSPYLLTPLSSVTFGTLISVIIIKLFVAITNGLKLKYFARQYNVKLNWIEWLGLSSVTTFYSIFFPARLGGVPRIVYLRKIKNFKYTDQAVMITSAGLLDLVITALVGLAALLCSPLMEPDATGRLKLLFFVILFFAMCGFLVVLYGARIFFFVQFDRLQKIGEKVKKSVELLLENKKNISFLILTISISLVTRCVALFISFWAIGYEPKITHIVVSMCLVNMSIFVSVTPGNIGFTEGALLMVFSLVGVPLEFSVAAVVISRAGSLLIQVVLGVIFSYVLFGRLKTIQEFRNWKE